MGMFKIMMEPANVKRFATEEYAKRQDRFYRKWLHDMPVSQYVYLIKDAIHEDTYKIGKTVNPYKRLTRFDVKLPFPFYIISILELPDCTRYETFAHQYFLDKHIQGEWYRLNAQDVANIKAVELFMPVRFLDNRSGTVPLVKPSPQKDFFDLLNFGEVYCGE